MKIETKYNLDDVVWFMQHDKPVSSPVKEIGVHHKISEDGIRQTDHVGYWIEGNPHQYASESQLYPSKLALRDAVFNM